MFKYIAVYIDSLTLPGLGDDRLAGGAGLTRSGRIDGPNAELVLSVLLQMRNGSLAIGTDWHFGSLQPLVGALLTLLNDVTGDGRTTIRSGWSPLQVDVVAIPVEWNRRTRCTGFIWTKNYKI